MTVNKIKSLKHVIIVVGPLIGIFALVVAFFGVPAKIIVSATVLSTREDIRGQGFPALPGRYLSSINITLAYPSHHPIWSVRSDCPLSQGQQVQVKVPALQRFYGFTPPEPIGANTTLYREQGIGYVQWNGCPST